MFSHSAITAVFMLIAPWLIGPIVAAAFMTGIWFSREQYREEMKLRKVDRDGWKDVLWTMCMVFRPMKRNLDFFAPVIVAWAMAYGYGWVFGA